MTPCSTELPSLHGVFVRSLPERKDRASPLGAGDCPGEQKGQGILKLESPASTTPWPATLADFSEPRFLFFSFSFPFFFSYLFIYLFIYCQGMQQLYVGSHFPDQGLNLGHSGESAES